MKSPHAVLLLLLASTIASADDGGWKVVSKSPTLTLYSRARSESPVKELKAVGTIDAPTSVTRNVIDDAEHYADFMPYVVESRVLSRSGDSLIGYQRLSPPLVSARDYTLRVRNTSTEGKGGTTFRSEWKTANDLGPAERSSTIRVKLSEGSWLLEPDGRGTRATYQVFTDAGGAIPAFIANRANTTAIPRLFEAVRKQARDQKYWKNEMPSK